MTDTELHQLLVKRLNENGNSVREASSHLKISRGRATRLIKKYGKSDLPDNKHNTSGRGPVQPSITTDYSKDKVDVDIIDAKMFKTEQEAAEHAGIDLSIWECTRFRTGTWGNPEKPMFSCRAEFAKKSALGTSQDQLFTDALNYWRTKSKFVPKVKKTKGAKEYCLQIAITDHHVGANSWGEQTGRSWDIQIAVEEYLKAVKFFLDNCPVKPTQIVFQIGGDMMHYFSDMPQTKSGHILDVDSRFELMFSSTMEAYKTAIDMCLKVAPTHIIPTQANHDGVLTFSSAHVLSAYYHNNENLTVDMTPRNRIYHRWHKHLTMFTHGDKCKPDKLPEVMAAERPSDWAETNTHRVLIGHVHHEKCMKFIYSNTLSDCEVQICPTLFPGDRWAIENGYLSGKTAALAFVLDPRGGVPFKLEYRTFPDGELA